MKTPAETCYPDYKDGDYGPSDYTPMIRLMEYDFGDAVLRLDDNDYQGDTYVLFHKENQFTCLIFGWGSCSGCDALQACQSKADINQLYNELKNKAIIKTTRIEALDWFTNHDWESQFIWHAVQGKRFVAMAKAYLLIEDD